MRPSVGYHLREVYDYYEIVDSMSGMTKAPGEWGEIVVTTLTRTAMPLIRYRTGDMSRFLPRLAPRYRVETDGQKKGTSP